jgi:RND family efflux transporter MFP subunit
MQAERLPMERIISLTGSLEAQEKATISVKVAGRVKTLAVDIGSVLRQGELIAQIEPRDYELRVQQAAAALAQARATVGLPLEGNDDQFDPEKTTAGRQTKAVFEEARKNYQRVKSLHEQGVLARSELDTAESVHTVALNRYEAALEEARTRQAALAQRRAEYELARQQLSDTSVRAPFDGVLQARLVGLGEFLAAGAPVAELVQVDPMRLRLEVSERESASVRAGQAVRLTVEGDTNIYRGVLARISPALEDQTRVLVVQADVPSQGVLRPGLFARAQIVIQADDPGLAVSSQALVVFAGLEKVVVVHEGKAAERPITTGRRGPGWIEVVSGLQPGEQVILNPGNLRSGQAVVVESVSDDSSGGTASWAR